MKITEDMVRTGAEIIATTALIDAPKHGPDQWMGLARAILESAADAGWNSDMGQAPKDGSSVIFPLEGVTRAYWCNDLKRWVMDYPLHMEVVPHPTRFRIPRVAR